MTADDTDEKPATRVRRKRVAIAVAAALVVIFGVGTVAAAAMNGKNDHVSVSQQERRVTSTKGTASMSRTTAPTTTSTATPVVIVPPETGSAFEPAGRVAIAEPGDVTGTLTLVGTSLVAGVETPVTLTLQNVSGHVIAVPASLGVRDYTGSVFAFFGLDDATPTLLAPGEPRAFTTTITAPAYLIGPNTIAASFLESYQGGLDPYRSVLAGHSDLPGVSPVAIAVVPPGWAEGDPLDPTQTVVPAKMTTSAPSPTSTMP